MIMRKMKQFIPSIMFLLLAVIFFIIHHEFINSVPNQAYLSDTDIRWAFGLLAYLFGIIAILYTIYVFYIK